MLLPFVGATGTKRGPADLGSMVLQGTAMSGKNIESRKPEAIELGRQIDENLKRAYDEALREDIPDRFKDLLAKLRAKGSAE
jgi:hypothetical protein